MCIHLKLKDETILTLRPVQEKVRPDSVRAVFAVGIPAAVSLLLFDLCNIVINRLSASYGDIELAAIGIVLNVFCIALSLPPAIAPRSYRFTRLMLP